MRRLFKSFREKADFRSAKAFPEDLNLVAFLGAFCFFLSAVEYMVPKPLPFMRLGISNLPIVLALELLPASKFFLLVLLKAVGMSVISGSLLSYIFLFSLAGSFASGTVMYLLKKALGGRIGFIGTSVLGASFSNLAQIGMARIFIFGPSAWLIGPPFLAVGTVTGILLGLFCEGFASSSLWYRHVLPKGPQGSVTEPASPQVLETPRSVSSGTRAAHGKFVDFTAKNLSPAALFLSGIAIGGAFLFAPSLAVRAGMLLAFFTFASVLGKKPRMLSSLLVMSAIVLFNLFVPAGKVLARLWNFRITETALIEGLSKAVTLQGLVFLSRATVRPDVKLGGVFGEIVSRSFFWFELITERGPGLDAKDVFGSIDRLMISLYVVRPKPLAEKAKQRYPALGYAALSLLAALFWAASLLA